MGLIVVKILKAEITPTIKKNGWFNNNPYNKDTRVRKNNKYTTKDWCKKYIKDNVEVIKKPQPEMIVVRLWLDIWKKDCNKNFSFGK